MKKIISGVIGTIIMANTLVPISVNARVIEPEIVKTETWTTSYYIDDDIETLYPYIDCQADIYNDGTVKVSFWNTHEWDGFATVSHDITLVNSLPFSTDSPEYAFKNHIEYDNHYPCLSIDNNTCDYSFFDKQDISFYPKEYIRYKYNQPVFDYRSEIKYYTSTQNGNTWTRTLYYYKERCPLAKLSTTYKYNVTYIPQVDIVNSYEFRILGHSFTITPELLSGNVVAEPQLSETEQKIKNLEVKISNLETENAKLKSENEQLLNMLKSQGNRAYGDMDNNGFVDGRDATILLTYYAKTSVGYRGTLEEFISSLSIK